MKGAKTAALAVAGMKLAVKYGPQAKIAWDKGGKQAAASATKRARSMNARRKAFAHADGVVDGSVLKIAPSGSTLYVVFSGDRPIASYPPQELPYPALLEHADLSRREHPPVSSGASQKLPRPRKGS